MKKFGLIEQIGYSKIFAKQLLQKFTAFEKDQNGKLGRNTREFKVGNKIKRWTMVWTKQLMKNNIYSLPISFPQKELTPNFNRFANSLKIHVQCLFLM